MLPLTVTFYWMDGESVEKVRTHLKTAPRDNDYWNHMEKAQFPEISACFEKTAPKFIRSEEEYVNLRKELEANE